MVDFFEELYWFWKEEEEEREHTPIGCLLDAPQPKLNGGTKHNLGVCLSWTHPPPVVHA